jgi:hypothetical protein
LKTKEFISAVKEKIHVTIMNVMNKINSVEDKESNG